MLEAKRARFDVAYTPGGQIGRERRLRIAGRLSVLLTAAGFCVLALTSLTSESRASEVSADRVSTEKNFEVEMSPETGLSVQRGTTQISLHGYAWGRAEVESEIGDETNLAASIPVARLFATGNFLESRLGFFSQVEFAGDGTELLDLFAAWRVDDALNIRIGQFRTPYSRAYITPLTNLELTSRGLVVDRFKLGRDTGAMFSGTVVSSHYHYDLAVVNGASINDLDGIRDAPSAILRNEFRFGELVPYDQSPSLTLNDASGFVLGLGGAYSKRSNKDVNGTSSERLVNASADIAVMQGPLSVRVETFWRGAQGSPRPSNAFGTYAQAGIFVLPRRLEVGGRAGWMSDGPDTQSYEAFVAGYAMIDGESLGQHLKLVCSYRYDSADPKGGSRQDRHTGTLQAQLFF